MKIYLRLCVPLLLATMACAFVRNMVFPPLPTPVPPTPSQTPGPVPSATLPPNTPTPEPFTCPDEDCLDACLDRLNNTLETQPLESIGNDNYEEGDAQFDLVIYKVNGDEISDPRVLHVPPEYRKYQEDTEAHQRIWDFYVAFIPPELRSTIKSFVIFTDGPSETTAWVSRRDKDEDYSRVGFDLLDSTYPPYLADTLAHETAHLLTLNSSQVKHADGHSHPYDAKQKTFFECDQYAADGGCSLPDSYINLFYQKFWKDSYAEWWKVDQKAQKVEGSDKYWDILEKDFYAKHHDWFLDSYAATSIEEDMAESFSYFVLHSRPKVRRIYQEKIAFYYDFPELVEYRQQMIEGLCSYIQ